MLLTVMEFLVTFFACALILDSALASKKSYNGSFQSRKLDFKSKNSAICQKINHELGQDDDKTFINQNILKEEELSQLEDFNEDLREIALHLANLGDLYKDYDRSGLDLSSHIKSKLYLGYNPDLETVGGLKISKLWQEKVWLGMDLNRIFEILANDIGCKTVGVGVLQVSRKEHIKDCFYAMISISLQKLLPKKEIILLNPNYEEFLIGTYRGGKQTLTEHIMLQLYPHGFFPLKGINVPEEKQKKILGLLKPSDITWKINECDDSWNSNYEISKFFQTKQVITKLRDAVIFNYWEELSQILISIPGLEGLSRKMNWPDKDYYESLCEFISVIVLPGNIIFEELRKATNDWTDNAKIYPDGFFLLENTVVTVNSATQQKIFELWFKDKYKFSWLFAKLDYHKQDEYDIVNFIKQPNTMNELRNTIITSFWKPLMKILATVPGLEDLSECFKENYLRWYEGSYVALCKFISKGIMPRVTVYRELDKATEHGNNGYKLCPEGFFSLGKTDLVNPESQQLIFGLLFEDKYGLADTLVKLKYHKRKIRKLEDFIKQPEIMKELRHMVLSRHCKTVRYILSMVPILEVLAEYPEEICEWHMYSYERLCNFILKVIPIGTVYRELKEATYDWNFSFVICPTNFFRLEAVELAVNLGFRQKERQQHRIFKLLFDDRYKLSRFLVSLGYLEQNKFNISGFIQQEGIMANLQERVVSKYWGKLIRILKVPGLKKFSRNAPLSYKKLDELIMQEMNSKNKNIEEWFAQLNLKTD